ALTLHVGLKLPTMLMAFRERGLLAPLRESLPETAPEPYRHAGTAPLEPAEPTISRRGFVAAVGGASALLGLMAGAQSVGGPLRPLGLLAPHGRDPGPGPHGFQVNKTARAVGIRPPETRAGWRLQLERDGAAPAAM